MESVKKMVVENTQRSVIHNDSLYVFNGFQEMCKRDVGGNFSECHRFWMRIVCVLGNFCTKIKLLHT